MRNRATLATIVLAVLALNASADEREKNTDYRPSLQPYLLEEVREIALARSADPDLQEAKAEYAKLQEREATVPAN